MRVSAVVPAYNEAPRIGRVLDTLTSFRDFLEVIVVDDGSTDGTGGIAARRGARVVRSEKNCGKGEAMQRGGNTARGNVLFFCDADIVGLTHDIIRETIAPVIRCEYEMFVAARKEKERRFGAYSYSPLLDGQRAVTRELWERVPANLKTGFAIESALNHCARSRGYRLFDITQVKKEAKHGIFAGTLARYAMYGRIAITRAQLLV
jgi:glycosyltransferase involved in cell wall biosynthesis